MPININIEGPETKKRRLLEEQERNLRMQVLKQQIAESQPGYTQQMAGQLGRGLEESERNLQLQEELIADVGRRREAVAAAGRELPEQAMGPVAPQSYVVPETNRLLTAESQLMLDAKAMSAQRESIRKQLEGLTGTVPLPGGGTAAAGETSTVRRRFQETKNLIEDYQNLRKNAKSQEELQALDAAYAMFEPIQKQQLKRDLEESRKIPGLSGVGFDEKSASEMRKNVADFAGAVQNVNTLLDIGSRGFNISNYQQAEAIRGTLGGQLRVIIAGPGPMSDQDRKLMSDIIANPFMPYSSEKLLQVKGAISRKIASNASVYGYKIDRLSDLVGAGGQPQDFEEFTKYNPADLKNAEQRAREAGYKDGDIIEVGGKKYRLGQ